jgi:hypothetical protein
MVALLIVGRPQKPNMRPPPGFLYPTELKRFVRESRTIDLASTVQHSWPTGDQAARRRANQTRQQPARPQIVKPFAKKYSSLPNIRIILYCSLSRPTKGALRNVNNAGRDAVDAEGALDEGT